MNCRTWFFAAIAIFLTLGCPGCKVLNIPNSLPPLTDRQAKGYWDAGETLRDKHDYIAAIEQFKQLYLRDKSADPVNRAAYCDAISDCYLDIEQFADALPYCLELLPLTRKIGDKKREASTLSNLGSIYIEQGQYYDALTYLGQGLTIAKQIGD